MEPYPDLNPEYIDDHILGGISELNQQPLIILTKPISNNVYYAININENKMDRIIYTSKLKLELVPTEKLEPILEIISKNINNYILLMQTDQRFLNDLNKNYSIHFIPYCPKDFYIENGLDTRSFTTKSYEYVNKKFNDDEIKTILENYKRNQINAVKQKK